MRTLFSAVVLAGTLLAATPALANLDTAVAIVKSQPRVLDAVPDNAGNLWVSVLPTNGVNWSAYAAAMCRMVVPQQARIFLVKIIDATTVKASKNPRDWHLLGGANCAR